MVSLCTYCLKALQEFGTTLWVSRIFTQVGFLKTARLFIKRVFCSFVSRELHSPELSFSISFLPYLYAVSTPATITTNFIYKKGDI